MLLGGVLLLLGVALRRRGLDPSLLNPWNFATAEDFAALLRARGFEVIESRLFARPTPTAAKTNS